MFILLEDTEHLLLVLFKLVELSLLKEGQYGTAQWREAGFCPLVC